MDTPTQPGSPPAGAADTARQAVHDLTDKAKDQAGDLAGKAKDAATDRLADGKEHATGVLADVAEALHHTSDTLRDNDQDAFAKYADVAARQVEQFTEAIRGRSVGELLDEAEGFARREPALFLGGAFLLGIFGARFLKASGMAGGSSPGSTSRTSGTRGLLSQMTVPGTANQHVANVNRPASSPYSAEVAGGRTMGTAVSGGSAAGGSMAGGHVSGATMGTAPRGLSGNDLPANSPAAAGASSMRTAVGTPPAGADAPVRSGPGASPLSSGSAGGSTSGPGSSDAGRL